MKKALVLVDIQKDFLPGGALAVPDGDQIIPIANRLVERFDFVVATQDWHPPNHGSFVSQHSDAKVGDLIELAGLEQIVWPDHCVQGTSGAEFANLLNMNDDIQVVHKGTDPAIDSYSGFFDNGHRRATDLQSRLETAGVQHVFLLGLATDYCVKFTALDAKQIGFETTLIADACRGVNLQAGDVDRAVEEMRTAGVKIAESNDILLD